MARLHEFVWSREILGSDARDRNRHAVQRSAAPDDRGIAPEALLPIGITQDDDRTSSEFIAFAGKKEAAIGRLYADRLKEIAGDIVDKHALTSVIGCEAANAVDQIDEKVVALSVLSDAVDSNMDSHGRSSI